MQDIIAKKVIERMLNIPRLSINIFEDLNLDLQNKGDYSLNDDLFFFPYDWRLDLNKNKNFLKQKIDAIKSQMARKKLILSHTAWEAF